MAMIAGRKLDQSPSISAKVQRGALVNRQDDFAVLFSESGD